MKTLKKSLKIYGRILLTYFCILLIYIIVTWGKYFINMSKYGGEMADSIFLLLWIVVSIYFSVMTLITYNTYLESIKYYNEIHITSRNRIVLKYLIVTLFGVVLSIYGILEIYVLGGW